MTLADDIRSILASKSLLKHPFYEAWTKGELSLDTLRMYAAQYYRQVEAFPRWVSSVHSRCPEISARKVLLGNLVDEELHGADHPELWMQFARGLGLKDAAVLSAPPLPETQAAVDALYALTASHWTRGLSALFAYEAQVPEVSQSKMDGLRQHYGIADDGTLAFFQAHLAYDVAHANAAGELMERYADRATAKTAAAEAADALWGFLDGVAREAGVRC